MSAQLVVQCLDGRYHFRFRCDDSDLWREIKDDFKAQFDPRDERRYDPNERAWSVPEWCRARLHRWADEHFPTTNQTWRDEDGNLSADDDPSSMYGWHARQRSYQQQHAPPPPPRRSPHEEAMAALHLLPSAPWEVAQAAHRAIKAFFNGGFDALPNKPRGGKQSALSAAMLESVRAEVATGTRTWTAAQLADWVAAQHGVRLSTDRLRVHLRRAKISWQRTSRTPRHKQDPAQVAERQAALDDLEHRGRPV